MNPKRLRDSYDDEMESDSFAVQDSENLPLGEPDEPLERIEVTMIRRPDISDEIKATQIYRDEDWAYYLNHPEGPPPV